MGLTSFNRARRRAQQAQAAEANAAQGEDLGTNTKPTTDEQGQVASQDGKAAAAETAAATASGAGAEAPALVVGESLLRQAITLPPAGPIGQENPPPPAPGGRKGKK